MEKFLTTLRRQGLRGDGAMGTMVQRQGLPAASCPELWNLTHPECILAIHQEYLQAGSQVIQTNTFGATRWHLARYGLASHTGAINRQAVTLARQASGGHAYILGTLAPPPPPESLASSSDMPGLQAAYREQCVTLQAAGVDGLLLETVLRLHDVLWLLETIGEVLSQPLLVSFVCTAAATYGGDPLPDVVHTLSALGVAGLGSNCGRTPEETMAAVQTMRRYTDLPLVLQASAGLPQPHGTSLRYPYTPEHWAEVLQAVGQSPGLLLGGCCGTTPEYIRALCG